MVSVFVLLTLHSWRAAAQHETVNFNHNWKYYVGDLPWQGPPTTDFPISLNGSFIRGLTTITGVKSEAECAAQCGSSCQVYQFCQAAYSVGSSALCLPATTSSKVSESIGMPRQACSNTSASFPLSLNNWQCSGLSAVSASSELECAAACCNTASCDVYQWCPADNPNCGPSPSCWIGSLAGGCSITSVAPGWISRGRTGSAPASVCQTGLLADYGPGNIDTYAGAWAVGARLAPSAPPAQTSGPAVPSYNDADWVNTTLPVDYLAFLAPTDDSPVPHQLEHGAIPFRNAWFRKNFTVPDGVQLARLQFDGIYRSATLFLNGALAGQHEEGYTGFSVWIHNVSGAPLIPASQGVNTLAVRIDDTTYTYELWSYEGAGFREASLHLHYNPVSISPYGVFVRSSITSPSPHKAVGSYLAANALVAAEIDVSNDSDETHTVNISVSIGLPRVHLHLLSPDTLQALGWDGPSTISSFIIAEIPAHGWVRVSPPSLSLSVLLWAPASAPTDPPRPLYTLVSCVALAQQAGLADSVNTSFGVRSVVFDASNGLFINGVPTRIRGLSVHQDFLAVGTALPPALHKFRLNQLLAMGANGYRTAHNPVSTSFLDAADEVGVLVWSENRFLRMFSQYVDDACDMVRRDRNHPSVILWSLCNENGCGEAPNFEGSPPGQMAGAALAAMYMKAMKEVDDTRPITANAHNTAGQNGSIYESLDVLGLTYDYASLSKIHEVFPTKPLLNGESCSCQSDRGSSAGVSDNAIDCSTNAWRAALALPYVAGQFVWSGWDYRGESSWPSVYSHYGVHDIAGFPKPVWNWYRAWWGDEAGLPSFVAAFPPWDSSSSSSSPLSLDARALLNQTHSAASTISITALTAAPYVQLFVNGIPHSPRQSVAALSRSTWSNIPFQPGNYSVLAYNDTTSSAIASFTSVTPGSAVALVATLVWPKADIGCVVNDGVDVAVIWISVVDQKGITVSSATNTISVVVSGGGLLLGMNNGDTTSHEPSAGTSTLPAYVGTAAALVQSVAGSSQTIAITATSPGLSPARLLINLC